MTQPEHEPTTRRSSAGQTARRALRIDDDLTQHLQVKEVVYRRLVRAIVELELQPGEQLRERQLAEEMGVSKTPIREALVRLEKEGLVTVAPYRGAVVRGYSPTDVREIYELRELLEGWCARTAAMRMSEQDEAELRANVQDSRRVLDQGTTERLPALFEAFDRILARQADGHRIGALLTELTLHLERLGNLTLNVPGRLDASVRQHEAILHAITTRDPAGAETACRDHIRSVYADLVNELAPGWGTHSGPST